MIDFRDSEKYNNDERMREKVKRGEEGLEWKSATHIQDLLCKQATEEREEKDKYA